MSVTCAHVSMNELEVQLTVRDLGYVDVYRTLIVSSAENTQRADEDFGGPLISFTELFNVVSSNISRKIKGNVSVPGKPEIILRLLAGNLREDDLQDNDKGFLTSIAESAVSSLVGKFSETFPAAKNIVTAAALGSIGWIVADYVGGVTVKLATVSACVLYAMYAAEPKPEEQKLLNFIKGEALLDLERKYGADMWEKLVPVAMSTSTGVHIFLVFPKNLPRIRATFDGRDETARFLDLDIKLGDKDRYSWLYIKRDVGLTPSMVHTALTDPSTSVTIQFIQPGSVTFRTATITEAEKRGLLRFYDSLPPDTPPDWTLFGTAVNDSKQLALVTADEGLFSWFGKLFGLGVELPTAPKEEELQQYLEDPYYTPYMPDLAEGTADNSAEGTADSSAEGTADKTPAYGFAEAQVAIISFGAARAPKFP